jgi:hypothetical protein
MQDDPSRPVATRPDSDFTLSIDEALERYVSAGHPRTPRSVQRYCAKGHLQCRLVETGTGERYLIAGDSIDKHIAYIEEVTPVTRRDQSGLVATRRPMESKVEQQQNHAAASADNARPVATSPDWSRYVARLENENGFLRGQITVKDEQIKDLTERARETNHLIAGLQQMFLLDGTNDPRE